MKWKQMSASRLAMIVAGVVAAGPLAAQQVEIVARMLGSRATRPP